MKKIFSLCNKSKSRVNAIGRIFLFYAFTMVYILPSYAEQTTPLKSSSTSQIANLLGGLALILVLIFGLSWFVKRFSQGGFMQNPAIKMIAAMPLGTSERIMLVEVGGKQLLLGVTATQISSLHVFDEPVIHSAQKPKNNSESSDFSQKLMAILQQKNTLDTNSSSSQDVEK